MKDDYESIGDEIYRRDERIEQLESAIREHKASVLNVVSVDEFMWPPHDKKLWSVLKETQEGK